MTTIALVSALSDEQKQELLQWGRRPCLPSGQTPEAIASAAATPEKAPPAPNPDSLQVLDFSQRRDALAEEGAEVEIVYGNVRAQEFPKLPRLQWIHAPWTGVENLLYPELAASSVIITCTRGHSGVQMAEHLIAGMFYLARDFGAFRQASMEGVWRPKTQITKIEGSRALVMGLGGIGREVAKRCKALGMRVRGVNSTGSPSEHCDEVFALREVRAHLADVNHVLISLPGTPHTRHAVDDHFLGSLAPGATIGNVGRGCVIDEAALLRHIDSGQIRGAVLDVTDPEPPPPDSPLWRHPRILLTGHQSSSPHPGSRPSFQLFLDNLRHYLDGRRDLMRSVVKKDMGY